jgi:hypothetical protein
MDSSYKIYPSVPPQRQQSHEFKSGVIHRHNPEVTFTRIVSSKKHGPCDVARTLGTPDQRNLINCKEFSEHQYLLFWLFTFELHES